MIHDPRRINKGLEGAKDEEKVLISAIEGGKSPKRIISADQVSQCVENNARIGISNVENDKSATVFKDVQFVMPLIEALFRTNVKDKV